MAVSIPDFWNLLVASRLASRNSIPKLQEKFGLVKGADTQGNAVTLAQWLISQGAVSRYQAKVLLAGHPGPFIYGDYTVYDRHAEGPLAGAFRAIHPATRHRVLLWFHSGAAVQNPQWWAALTQQASIFRQAVHPHIDRLYHLADLGQFKFTVLEDLQGETALQRLQKGPLPWPVACRMVRQAALGLAKLFELGQLHGALRPGNLWIDEQENIKLMLPPLARDLLEIPGPIDVDAIDPRGPVSRQADYMAPELAQPGQAPGGRTEVYALGCTLFQMLTGRVPFGGNDALAKLANHAGQKTPVVDANYAPQMIGQILAVMMAKDPQRRYQNARQLVDVLTHALQALDPDQLKWPATPQSNKLPEYEAWLTPYGLAAPSKPSDAPDFDMPPILAAGLQQRPQFPPDTMFPDAPMPGGNPSPPASPASMPGAAPPGRRGPPPLPGSQPPQTKPSQMQSSASPAGTSATVVKSTSSTPAQRIAPSKTAILAAEDQTASVTVVEAPKPSSAANGHAVAAVKPSKSRPKNDSPVGVASAMNFPPEDDDFIGAITGKPKHPKKKPVPTESREDSSNRKRPLVFGAIAVGLVLIGAIVWAVINGQHGSSDIAATSPPPAADASATTTNTEEKNPPAKEPQPLPETSAAPANEPDESQSLWASPTQGSPLSLAHLSSGVQAVLVLRPADLMRQADAEKVLAALGPDAAAVQHELETAAGAPLANIEQLAVAWVEQSGTGGAASITPMYVVRFANPPEKKSEPTSADPSADSQTDDSKSLATYSPPDEAGKLLVVGPPAVIAEVTKQNGHPPPMRRDLEMLLRTTDDQRLATFLWCPNSNALRSGDGQTSNDKWNMLRTAAKSLLGDEIRAAALSANLSSDDLFLELRVRGPLDQSADAVAKQIQKRLDRLPDGLKKYLDVLTVQPYGKDVLARFPQMLKVLGEFVRSGTDKDQIVLRTYLPAAAAHNLLLASELALSEAASAGSSHAGGSPGGSAQPPETIAQKLKRKTTLTFVNEPLDKTMQLLADDLGIKIEILGPDLQLDGITKNQAIRDLNETDKPAAEILRNIMLKANTDGKLVYVIKSRAPGGEEELLVTTRAAAAKRGDKLPDDLATPPAKK